MQQTSRFILAICLVAGFDAATCLAGDYIRELQFNAVKEAKSPLGHWGVDRDKYMLWATHSNRLIPVYTFGSKNAATGVRLADYSGEHSPYRSENELKRLYGHVPDHTLDPAAEYLDQTNIYDMQKAALAAGKKYIFLVIFDGMDWNTTRAAAIYNTQRIAYCAGRGTGTHFQEYTAGGTTEFGYMVTSPHNDGTKIDVDLQTVLNPGGKIFGGYHAPSGGTTPWSVPPDLPYLIGKGKVVHAYTDSSSSASSMTAGIKTFNGAVNVDPQGIRVETIAHLAQEQGRSAGAVTSVPISHATPAAAYAHNVERDDYQDLTRDLLGLKSVSHPEAPLSGLDVLIGGGFGVLKEKNPTQGLNFVPKQIYLTDADRQQVDVANGGQYVVAERTAGKSGSVLLESATARAVNENKRLLGFFGVGKYNGHLPFATADRDFRPSPGRLGKAEEYTEADLLENPSLTEMTAAAITRLSTNPKGFWLMVESGDVDWANHDNNLDNSIGAVNSGDKAVKYITDWVEKHSNWDESLVIVTADHGHYLFLEQPELLIHPK